jgi:hypothetical protein
MVEKSLSVALEAVARRCESLPVRESIGDP